ncbi:MAG: FHA domain-containing protein [Pseudomonadota bacterium]
MADDNNSNNNFEDMIAELEEDKNEKELSPKEQVKNKPSSEKDTFSFNLEEDGSLIDKAIDDVIIEEQDIIDIDEEFAVSSSEILEKDDLPHKPDDKENDEHVLDNIKDSNDLSIMEGKNTGLDELFDQQEEVNDLGEDSIKENDEIELLEEKHNENSILLEKHEDKDEDDSNKTELIIPDINESNTDEEEDEDIITLGQEEDEFLLDEEDDEHYLGEKEDKIGFQDKEDSLFDDDDDNKEESFQTKIQAEKESSFMEEADSSFLDDDSIIDKAPAEEDSAEPSFMQDNDESETTDDAETSFMQDNDKIEDEDTAEPSFMQDKAGDNDETELLDESQDVFPEPEQEDDLITLDDQTLDDSENAEASAEAFGLDFSDSEELTDQQEPISKDLDNDIAAVENSNTPKTAIFDYSSPKLTLYYNDKEADSFILDKEESIIGRMENNDIIVTDPNCSRNHAKIIKDGQDFYLIDLGSTNGTIINGKKVKRHKLVDGDRIDFAAAYLQFNTFTANSDGFAVNNNSLEEISEDNLDARPGWMKKLQLTRRKLFIYFFIICCLAVALNVSQQKKKAAKQVSIEQEIQKIPQDSSEITDKINRYNYIMEEGKKFYDDHKFEEASDKFNQALKLDTESEEAYTMLQKSKNALEIQDEITNLKAEEEKRKAQLAKIDKLEKRGLAQYNQNNYKDAESTFMEVQKSDKNNAIASKYLKIISNITSKSYQKILKDAKLEELVEEQLKLAEEYYKAGQIYKAILELKKLSNYKEIKDAPFKIRIDSVISSYEDSLKTKLKTKLQNALALWENGDKIQSREMIREILKEYPEYDEAKNEYNKLIEELSVEAQNTYHNAMIHERYDDVEESLKLYEKVIELLEPTDEYYKKATDKIASIKR